MSVSSAIPTTTYPFTYTTYSNSLSSTKFTTPTIIPSLFSFGPGLSCSANSVATPLPSQYPKNPPSGLKAACAISNDPEINDHAFWDLYACCKSLEMGAGGTPNLCTAQCAAGKGQTWQELGECLSQRVEVVVCKPAFAEIGRNITSSASGSHSVASQSQARTSSASGSGSVTGSVSQPAASTGGGSMVGVVHVGGSKAGVALFAVLAIGSFAGMML